MTSEQVAPISTLPVYGPVEKPISTKKRTSGRAPGRPHKKLEKDVLRHRIQELSKKLQLKTAQTTLLEDRLQVYKKEEQLRMQEGNITDVV